MHLPVPTSMSQKSKLPWLGVPIVRCQKRGLIGSSALGSTEWIWLWTVLSTLFFLYLWCYWSCLQCISCTDNGNFLSYVRISSSVCPAWVCPYCKDEPTLFIIFHCAWKRMLILICFFYIVLVWLTIKKKLWYKIWWKLKFSFLMR